MRLAKYWIEVVRRSDGLVLVDRRQVDVIGMTALRFKTETINDILVTHPEAAGLKAEDIEFRMT